MRHSTSCYRARLRTTLSSRPALLVVRPVGLILSSYGRPEGVSARKTQTGTFFKIATRTVRRLLPSISSELRSRRTTYTTYTYTRHPWSRSHQREHRQTKDVQKKEEQIGASWSILECRYPRPQLGLAPEPAGGFEGSVERATSTATANTSLCRAAKLPGTRERTGERERERERSSAKVLKFFASRNRTAGRESSSPATATSYLSLPTWRSEPR